MNNLFREFWCRHVVVGFRPLHFATVLVFRRKSGVSTVFHSSKVERNAVTLQYNAVPILFESPWTAAWAAVQIRGCFAMADQFVIASQRAGTFQAGERLTAVASNFYGGYWLPPGKSRPEKSTGRMPEVEPMVVLSEAFGWLSSQAE
jgi:hypothetical protein